MRLSLGQRQAALNALADGVVHAAGPCGKIQDVALVRAQHRRAAELGAEHLQRRADRLLAVRRGRNARENVGYERARGRAVAVNALGHIGDEVTVAQMPLSFRHTDEHKIVLVCDLDEPPVYARQIHAYIVQHEPDLAAVDEPHEV